MPLPLPGFGLLGRGDSNRYGSYRAVSFPQGRNGTQYQFVDDFSVTKGAHNLKFGANYRRYDITDYVFSEFSPAFGSSPLYVPFSLTDIYTGGADGTNEFLSNYPNRGTYPVALWGLGLYAQDEWRVSKSLKITLALRAEKNSNPVCQPNCAALFNAPFTGRTSSADQPTLPTTSQSMPACTRSSRPWMRSTSLRALDLPGHRAAATRRWFAAALVSSMTLSRSLGDSFMTNLPTVVPL